MAAQCSLTTDHQKTSNSIAVVNSPVDLPEQLADGYFSSETAKHHNHSPDVDNDMRIYDSYTYFKEKFNKTKRDIPMDLKNASILWSIDTASPPHIGYLPYLLVLNQLNKSNKTFSIISDVRGYFGDLDSSLSEHELKIKSYCEIINHFNIGSIIKSDDIYYTKAYQKSFFQLTRSVKIMDAIESARKAAQKSVKIEVLRASDLMSIVLILNDILYFNISHVLIEEHEVPLYQYISSLLLNEYEKKLYILEMPMFPDLLENEIRSPLIATNKILLNATKDQIHDQLFMLQSTRKSMIHNYLKAMVDVLCKKETSFQDKILSDMDISDTIDDVRKSILLSSSPIECGNPIYVAASFLTDQFHVLKKHWKNNVNKDDKCTGTGKGIDGLLANQKGFEPPLGGKFIIINWSNKEIVYMLDIDSPAGFFIEDHYLYIANNRLNYISVIDLIRRIEIKHIDNSAFNCLHSLHRAENETLLVTSTGIDAIIQTNSTGETLNDWYATEHEYTVTPKGEKRNVERDFNHHHYIYPTLHQTTHINSAIIFDSDHYLATLFHQGLLVKINRTDGKSVALLSGLNCPHAIKRYRCIKQDDIVWMLCNTKQNEILFLNDDFKITQKMILDDVSWLQDATQIENEHILITDANHSRIIEIDPDLNTVISEFFYSTDWRIYQISDLTDFQTNFIPTDHM